MATDDNRDQSRCGTRGIGVRPVLRPRPEHQRGPAGPLPAPGGVRVVGRQDRETILCTHTMDEHSLSRHWPVIVSRLEKAGLSIVEPA